MKLVDRAGRLPDWLSKAKNLTEKVLFSSAVLKRNLLDYPFPNRADESELRDVQERIAVALELLPDVEGEFFSLDGMSNSECELLRERFVRVNCEGEKSGRGAFLSEDEQVSVVVNGNDHLELEVKIGGLNVKEAMKTANDIDNFIGSVVEFAFADGIGFLTADPFEAGLAMHLGVALHLPGIATSRQLKTLSEIVQSANLRITPVFQNGLGNVFRMESTRQLGASENEVYTAFTEVLDLVMDLEDDTRDMLLEKFPLEVEDRIRRSLAVLRSALILEFEEAIELLSMLRLGLSLGLLSGITFRELDETMFLTQPQHLKTAFAENDKVNLDSVRAAFVRSRIQKVSG